MEQPNDQLKADITPGESEADISRTINGNDFLVRIFRPEENGVYVAAFEDGADSGQTDEVAIIGYDTEDAVRVAEEARKLARAGKSKTEVAGALREFIANLQGNRPE